MFIFIIIQKVVQYYVITVMFILMYFNGKNGHFTQQIPLLVKENLELMFLIALFHLGVAGSYVSVPNGK